MRSVRIKWASSHYTLPKDDGIRIRIECECAVGLSTKLFAYRMEPVMPGGVTNGFFSHICSPVDMAEYPEDAPTPGQSPEWFRLDFVDVLVRSVLEAEDFILIVREDVRRLLRTLNKMDTIFTQGTEIVGDVSCQPSQSSSESSTGPLPSSESYSAIASLLATGTSEQSVGVGVSWVSVGTGAGSPIGTSDSLALNRSRVDLQAGVSSALLLVQGFDFSGLPDDAVIAGVRSRVLLRDATSDSASSNSLSADSNSSQGSEPAACPILTLLALQHPDRGMGTNRATNECVGGSAWETLIHGGDGDLWGFSALTGKDLKDGAFGLGLVVRNNSEPLGDETTVGCLIVPDYQTSAFAVEVDGVELEVFYREPM